MRGRQEEKVGVVPTSTFRKVVGFDHRHLTGTISEVVLSLSLRVQVLVPFGV